MSVQFVVLLKYLSISCWWEALEVCNILDWTRSVVAVDLISFVFSSDPSELSFWICGFPFFFLLGFVRDCFPNLIKNLSEVMQTRQIATRFRKKNCSTVGFFQKKIIHGAKCCGEEAFKGNLSKF